MGNRYRIVAALAFGLAACHPFSMSDVDAFILKVDVTVIGDAQLGPAEYPVTIDGLKWRAFRAGQQDQIALSSGSHLVQFSGPEPDSEFFMGSPVLLPPSWCGGLGLKQRRIESVDSSVSLTYEVLCPPLNGTGELQISVSISHKNAPPAPTPDLKLTAKRIIGAAYQEERTVNTAGRLSLTVPVGIYAFSLSGTNCIKTIDDIAFGYRQAVVRAGGVGTTTLYITCP